MRPSSAALPDPGQSWQSNLLADAFVKSFKRDCVLVHERAGALKLLRGALCAIPAGGRDVGGSTGPVARGEGDGLPRLSASTKQGNRLTPEATYQALKPIVMQRLAARSQHVSK